MSTLTGQAHLESTPLSSLSWTIALAPTGVLASLPPLLCRSQCAPWRNWNYFTLSSYFKLWWFLIVLRIKSKFHFMVCKTLFCGLLACHHATLLVLKTMVRFSSFVFLNSPLLFSFWAFVAVGRSAGNVLQAPSFCGQFLLLVARFCSPSLALPPPWLPTSHPSAHIINVTFHEHPICSMAPCLFPVYIIASMICYCSCWFFFFPL